MFILRVLYGIYTVFVQYFYTFYCTTTVQVLYKYCTSDVERDKMREEDVSVRRRLVA